jgi:hypothetical protein
MLLFLIFFLFPLFSFFLTCTCSDPSSVLRFGYCVSPSCASTLLPNSLSNDSLIVCSLLDSPHYHSSSSSSSSSSSDDFSVHDIPSILSLLKSLYECFNSSLSDDLWIHGVIDQSSGITYQNTHINRLRANSSPFSYYLLLVSSAFPGNSNPPLDFSTHLKRSSFSYRSLFHRPALRFSYPHFIPFSPLYSASNAPDQIYLSELLTLSPCIHKFKTPFTLLNILNHSFSEQFESFWLTQRFDWSDFSSSLDLETSHNTCNSTLFQSYSDLILRSLAPPGYNLLLFDSSLYDSLLHSLLKSLNEEMIKFYRSLSPIEQASTLYEYSSPSLRRSFGSPLEVGRRFLQIRRLNRSIPIDPQRNIKINGKLVPFHPWLAIPNPLRTLLARLFFVESYLTHFIWRILCPNKQLNYNCDYINTAWLDDFQSFNIFHTNKQEEQQYSWFGSDVMRAYLYDDKRIQRIELEEMLKNENTQRKLKRGKPIDPNQTVEPFYHSDVGLLSLMPLSSDPSFSIVNRDGGTSTNIERYYYELFYSNSSASPRHFNRTFFFLFAGRTLSSLSNSQIVALPHFVHHSDQPRIKVVFDQQNSSKVTKSIEYSGWDVPRLSYPFFHRISPTACGCQIFLSEQMQQDCVENHPQWRGNITSNEFQSVLLYDQSQGVNWTPERDRTKFTLDST